MSANITEKLEEERKKLKDDILKFSEQPNSEGQRSDVMPLQQRFSKKHEKAPTQHRFFNVTGLPYLLKPKEFLIPAAVQRSTTADIVRTGKTKYDKQAQDFDLLRTKFSSNRSSWINTLQEYYFANNPLNRSPQSVIAATSAKLKNISELYKSNLLTMAENGIWNCMEFADYALITIITGDEFNREYEAHVAYLNDIKIPENSYFQYFNTPDGQILPKELFKQQNHDHAFVVITYRNEPTYVIDLWQSLANDKYYLGTIDNFITFLNERVDNRYVARRVSKIDFQLSTLFGSPKNASATSSEANFVAGQIAGYEGNSVPSPM